MVADPTAMTQAMPRRGAAMSEHRKISRVPYLPGLDGLRALAVIAVMIYHASPDWLPGGFLGVEVFFVISGYLITLLIVAENERSGRLDLKSFWIRRARRLLPALFAMLALVVIYTAVFVPDALGQLRGDVIAALTYVTNWYQIWQGQGYTAAGDFAPLRHLWSLAVEEQFYLIWPLVMLLLLSRGSRRVVRATGWMLGAAFLTIVLMAVAFQPGRVVDCAVTPEQFWQIGDRCISKVDTLYLSTITRSGGLLAGAAFALVWRPVALMRSPLRNRAFIVDIAALIGLVGLGAMTWLVFLMGPNGADPVLFRGGFLVAGVLTLMVLAGVTHQRSLSGPIIGNPVLLWIGIRSYGLYLYHWPIYQAIRKVAGNPLTVPQFIVAMILTVLITEASFRLIETPIREGTWRESLRRMRQSAVPIRRQAFVATAVVSSVLIGFGAVSLARAPLMQNEIAESLDQAADAVVSLEDLVAQTDGGDGGGGASPTPTTLDPLLGPNGEALVEEPAGVTDTTTTTSTTTTTTTLPPDPITYLAVGDSVMLGAAEVLRDNRVTVDAEVSRQMSDITPLLRELRERDLFGVAVISHLGTNGPLTQDMIDAFMEPLSAVPNVLVMTNRAPRNWTARNNELLRNLSSRPNVIVIDWERLSAECPGDCFYSDGIHLKSDGQRYYARLIFDVLGI